jgi:hypothetical protein
MNFKNYILDYDKKISNFNIKYGNYEKKTIEDGSNSCLLLVSNKFVHWSDNPIKYTKNINILNADTIQILLKFQKEKNLDNLFIEYLNGLYVNKLSKFYPNVVQTIGLFEINTNLLKCEEYKNIKLNIIEKIDINLQTIFSDHIIKKYLNCNDASKQYFFGVEYMDNTITLDNWLNKIYNHLEYDHLEYDIFTIIYQIYLFIDTVSKNFIHNDLHLNNVLIYELKNRIQLKYLKYTDKSVILYVKYIPIIIDYGRVYCNEINSKIDLLNMSKEQQYDCGKYIYKSNEICKLICFIYIMNHLNKKTNLYKHLSSDTGYNHKNTLNITEKHVNNYFTNKPDSFYFEYEVTNNLDKLMECLNKNYKEHYNNDKMMNININIANEIIITCDNETPMIYQPINYAHS